MLNIQFMTKAENGVPTGKCDYYGRPEYEYIPDFDKLIKNACCAEEIEAINNFKEASELYDIRMTYEIAYTVYMNGKWELCQHPWRENYGIRISQSQALNEVLHIIFEA